MLDSSFKGFDWPKENWFRVPNEWINVAAEISTLAELKIVMYILRHTWGFGDRENPKHITLDEFMFGRKRRDNSRIDRGVGMSKPSIINGIKQAQKDNLIEVEIDNSDMMRVKKWYKLKVRTDVKKSNFASKETLQCDTKESYTRSKETQHVTVFQKDTLERNNTVPTRNECGTNTSSSKISRNKEDQPHQSNGGFLPQEETTSSPSNFDMRCATELGNAVQKNHQTSRGNDLRKWSVQFRLLRTRDGASKDLIKQVLKWYVESDWNDKFLPQAFSGASFREKFFDRLVPGMKRSVGEEVTAGTENQEEKSFQPFTDEEWFAHCKEQDRGELGLSEEEYVQYQKDWEEEHNEKYETPYV